MSAQPLRQSDAAETLTKALLSAARILGLTQTDLGAVIGRDRTVFRRGSIDPHSKEGELGLLVIRAYRSLFVLVGGRPEDIAHWMHTDNDHIGGVPAERMKSVTGLIQVVEYLDAMRGRA